MSDSHFSAPAFRAASTAAQDELLAVLRRHDETLGGPLGQVHTLIELLGSVCKAVLDAAPPARPHIYLQLMDLAKHVAPPTAQPPSH